MRKKEGGKGEEKIDWYRLEHKKEKYRRMIMKVGKRERVLDECVEMEGKREKE